MTLEQLSAAATQGEWNTGSDLEPNYLYAGRHILAYMSSSQDDGEGGDSFVSGESEAVANAEFCARLVNLYRTGQLFAVQPDDATVERLARDAAEAYLGRQVDAKYITTPCTGGQDWVNVVKAIIEAMKGPKP